MLSDAVIEELTRKTALSEALVKLAWPSLSTEAKLHIVSAMQVGYSPSTPDWLTDLALDDAALIVQYMALRHSNLRTQPQQPSAFPQFSREVSSEDEERYRKAHAIENELVKAAVLNINRFDIKQTLTGLSQVERLVLLRNSTFSLGEFMDWLLDATKGGVPDAELAACVLEFMQKPETKRDLRTEKFDYRSGEAAFFAGKAMETGWEVLKHAGPLLQGQLYWSLPTELGLSTMKPEVLASMPPRVLNWMVTEGNPTKEIEALQEMVEKHPEQFPPETVEELAKHRQDDFEYTRWTKEEQVDNQRPDAPDPSRQTLEVVLELKGRLRLLKEELAAVKEAASARRGFFG